MKWLYNKEDFFKALFDLKDQACNLIGVALH